jgi:Copper type II ascorbate-dependent monooxygenase, C-terminal domain
VDPPPLPTHGWADGFQVRARDTVGVGVALPKDALVVMQMHYNFNNGVGQDRSSVSLDIAPEGKKQTELKEQLQFAPIEIPCAQGTNTPACDRDAVIQEITAKFGLIANQLPGRLLSLCGQKLERYQQPVGDASRVTSTCDRQAREDLTLHSVTGHMHLRGTSIKLEVNPNTNGAQTLLHIPRWDFHWQGSYWFEDPVQVKRGDVLRITCTYDNSSANQPVVAGKPLEPRYVVWGEGTTDEMCLGVLMASSRRN